MVIFTWHLQDILTMLTANKTIIFIKCIWISKFSLRCVNKCKLSEGKLKINNTFWENECNSISIETL